jgi:hypothetical protein
MLAVKYLHFEINTHGNILYIAWKNKIQYHIHPPPPKLQLSGKYMHRK